MALSDWVVNLNGTGTAATLNVSTPLVGNGSLALTTTNASATKSMCIHLGAGFTRGFTKGRIRTLIRSVATIPSSSATTHWYGITAMHSQLDIKTTGSFYAACWGMNATTGAPGSGNLYMFLGKQSAGSGADASFSSILGTISAFAVSNGDYYPFQFEWVYDLANLGGIRLTLSKGTLNSTDFGTLVPVIDVVDSSSPLSTSAGEGLAYGNASAHAVAVNNNFDETTVYELL